MKKILTGLLMSLMMTVFAQGVKVGDKAPGFALKNIDGEVVNMLDYSSKKGLIIIFTCNHCPYAKAYEQRVIDLQSNYGKDFQVIAINPNDATEYPDDSYENMIVRAKEKGFNFPYLYDETQEVAKAFGALKTPHVYVLSKAEQGFVVEYIGAIDDNYVNAKKAKHKYVEDAIIALNAGEKVNPTTTVAVGCSVKWKK